MGTTLLPTSLVGPAGALGAYQVGDIALAEIGTEESARRASLGTMWAGEPSALGRGVQSFDRPTLKDLAAKVEANDYRFSALVIEIVNSLPFQKRSKENT